MFHKRTTRSASRRLRLEFLETREVPDGNPTTETLPDPTAVDPATDPVQTTELDDPTVIFQTTSVPDVAPVDLATTMTVDRIKPSLNDVVTLKITLTNTSQVEATGVTATLTLPAGMTFVSSDTPDKYDSTTGTWSPGTIAALGKAVLMVKAKVTDVAEQQVTAAISHADQPDPKADNNSATVTLTPVLAKLNVAKSFSAAAVNVGSTVVMTVAVGNGGPGRARDVVLTNTLPEGLVFARVLSATQGNYNASTHTWTIGTIQPGSIQVLRMTVVVTKAGKLESASTATATGYDTTLSKMDVTGVITGVQSNNPATWAYFSGFAFQTSPGPVPRVAAPWHGAQITTNFLAAHGFKLNGFKLI